MDRTKELQDALAELGFQAEIRVTGRQGNELRYETVDGQPMMDGPAAFIRAGLVVLVEPSGSPD